MRALVVNADDFGLSPGVNRGILEAHERGILTSASLMVRGRAASDAADAAARRPRLSVGLHLDLAEWRHTGEAWVPIYEVVDTDDARAVEREVTLQLDAFRRLMDRDPTHLDSHQHVHRTEPVFSVLREAAGRIGVPLRDASPGVRYCGAFYGQSTTGDPLPDAITAGALIALIDNLPEGITELGCHPGLGDDAQSVYECERTHEVRALCDPSVRDAILARGIALWSFADAARHLTAGRRQ